MLFSHCVAATTFFDILDLETHFNHLRPCDLLAEMAHLVSNTCWHPRRKLKSWDKLRGWASSAYKLGWSPSCRDNLAAGISREAPSKLKPRELSTREPQWGSSCTVIWEHKPYHGAWGKSKNMQYWNIIKIKCDQGLFSPWVWGVSLRYLWFLI